MDSSNNERLIYKIIKARFHNDEIRNMCEKLVTSMPDHVKQVIAAKGGHINY
jgi:hypothetical protein